jgi:hypothetical protein
MKDLQKLVQSQLTAEENMLLERLGNKPFWIWNIEEHKQQDIKTKGDCLFWLIHLFFNDLIILP